MPFLLPNQQRQTANKENQPRLIYGNRMSGNVVQNWSVGHYNNNECAVSAWRASNHLPGDLCHETFLLLSTQHRLTHVKLEFQTLQLLIVQWWKHEASSSHDPWCRCSHVHVRRLFTRRPVNDSLGNVRHFLCTFVLRCHHSTFALMMQLH